MLRIFDIKRFAIHDGPGIRTTVFLKGCPLDCKWCHNPESKSYHFNIMINSDNCCECLDCVDQCNNNCLKFIDETKSFYYQYEGCNECKKCEKACLNNALSFVGKNYDIDLLVDMLKKDSVFYDESNGGITFSGGEPLLQINSLIKVLKRLKYAGFSICIDTCGYVNYNNFIKIENYVDIFLYDLKFIDDDLHKKYTGVSNKKILENYIKLINNKRFNVITRIPLIKGINSNEINEFCNFLKHVNVNEIELMRFHKMGLDKNNRIINSRSLIETSELEEFEEFSDNEFKEIINEFENNGIRIL